MVLGGAMMFIFWAGIVGLALWGIARLTRHSETSNVALEVVRKRYARGEITKEEFERIRRDL